MVLYAVEIYADVHDGKKNDQILMSMMVMMMKGNVVTANDADVCGCMQTYEAAAAAAGVTRVSSSVC